MGNDGIIVQKWFHLIEEFHDGKLIREVREVLDIYTNKNYLC